MREYEEYVSLNAKQPKVDVSIRCRRGRDLQTDKQIRNRLKRWHSQNSTNKIQKKVAVYFKQNQTKLLNRAIMDSLKEEIYRERDRGKERKRER